MVARRLRVLGLLAVTPALAAPAAASGAVTIGSSLVAPVNVTSGCSGSGCTITQRTLPASATASGGLRAPIDGVVVRWRIKFGAIPIPVTLRIVRQPNSLSDAMTGAGTGDTVTPGANQITPYDARLPILAGDRLGVDCCTGGASLQAASVMAMGTAPLSIWSPPLIDNDPPRSAGGPNDEQLLLNADIEPDADHDGFGDETQDQCPASAVTQRSCSNSFSLGKTRINTKKGTATIPVNLPNPGDLTASGKGVKAFSAPEALSSKSVGAGQTQVLVTAKGNKKRKLNETGKVKLNVAIAYTPTGGDPATHSVKVKLRKKR